MTHFSPFQSAKMFLIKNQKRFTTNLRDEQGFIV